MTILVGVRRQEDDIVHAPPEAASRTSLSNVEWVSQAKMSGAQVDVFVAPIGDVIITKTFPRSIDKITLIGNSREGK